MVCDHQRFFWILVLHITSECKLFFFVFFITVRLIITYYRVNFFYRNKCQWQRTLVMVFYRTLMICNQLRVLTGLGQFQTGYYNNFTEKKSFEYIKKIYSHKYPDFFFSINMIKFMGKRHIYHYKVYLVGNLLSSFHS